MGRSLIVANHGFAEQELSGSIRDRILRGDAEFFVLILVLQPWHDTAPWSTNFPFDGAPPVPDIEVFNEHEQRRDAALRQAVVQAEHTLKQIVEMVRFAGGEAEGTLADGRAAKAVKGALERDVFHAVVLSAQAGNLARWLRLDLPSRIRRMTDSPVIAVTGATVDRTS